MRHLLWLLVLRVVGLLLCLHHGTGLIRVTLLMGVRIGGGLLMIRVGFHTGRKRASETGAEGSRL